MEDAMLIWIAAGALSGLVTTVAGMGGGLLLVVVLVALLDDPVQALVVSSPALMLGTSHRLWLFRDHVDRSVAGSVLVGAVPAAFLGGLILARMPSDAVRWLLLGVAVAAAVRGLGLLTFTVPTRWGTPVGALAGVLHSTSGGAGIVLSPYLMARDLVGASYIGTMAVCAIGLHVPRLVAFGAEGLLDGPVLANGAVLAASIVGGNAIGSQVGGHLTDPAQRRVQVGALLATAGLAVAGLS